MSACVRLKTSRLQVHACASALDFLNGTTPAEDSGGSDAPPQQGPETSHLWLQPAFPLSVLARYSGNRVRVDIVKVSRTSPELREAFCLPYLKVGLSRPSALSRAALFLGYQNPSCSRGYQPKGCNRAAEP